MIVRNLLVIKRHLLIIIRYKVRIRVHWRHKYLLRWRVLLLEWSELLLTEVLLEGHHWHLVVHHILLLLLHLVLLTHKHLLLIYSLLW
jgi:hypothetical protein